MRRGCRVLAAAIVIAGWSASGLWADDAPGGLDARQADMAERFDARLKHSAAAEMIRTRGLSATGAANDFIVNNDGFGGASEQSELRVVRQPDGGIIAVWTDDRDANFSIYGQILDTGGVAVGAVGPNFRLHSDPSNLDQVSAAVVVRADGGFYAAYTEVKSNGDRDIRVNRYSRLGQRLGSGVNVAADSANFMQRRPSLTLLSDGTLVVVYERDSLNQNSSIFGQLLAADSLTRLGDMFAVSDDLTLGSLQFIYNEREPQVAADGNDTIWAVWTDDRDGGARDVFGQRLHLTDTTLYVDTLVEKIGSAFKINDEPLVGNALQNTPRVMATPDGRALAVWADFRNGQWDVYKQSFGTSGAKQDPNQIVNFGDVTSASQISPALSWSDSGGVAVWKDFREGKSRTYAQRIHLYDSIYVSNGHIEHLYDSSFVANGHRELVNDSTFLYCDSILVRGLAFLTGCDTVRAKDTDLVVIDTVEKRYYLYCDSLNVADTAWVIGTGCDTVEAADTAAVAIVATVTKKIDRIAGNFAVGASGTENQSGPACDLSPDGVFAVSWTEPSAGRATAYYSTIAADNSGTVAARTAEIIISAKQVQPSCGMSAAGDVFTVWEESRAALPNIVGQALTSSLTKPQGDQQVNLGRITHHFLPATSVGGSTGFVVWEDYRDTIQPVYSDIYLQRYSLDGTGYGSSGGNVRVIDTVESQEVRLASWNPDVATDASGRAMVVWQDNRFRSWDIFAARYSDSSDPTTGDPVRLGLNEQVDGAPLFTKQQYPRIDMNAGGQTVVVWEDTRSSTAGSQTFEIWARIYTNAGQTAVGPEFKLTLDPLHVPRQPDVAMATDGSFAVVYEEHSAGPDDVDIYFRRFTATGDTLTTAAGQPIFVNDDGLNVNQFWPRIAATAAGYVITWQDERDGNWDIFATLVPTGADVADDNYLVNDASVSDQTFPAIAAIRTISDPFICWEDLRQATTAPDIYGNRNQPPPLAAGGGPGGDDDVRPAAYRLNQNFPNPFNPDTEIRYLLARETRIELVIFNTLGQKVTTLIDGVRPAGENRIRWDGLDAQHKRVASGTYFYRLRWPEGEVTRSMTLLR